MQSFSGKSFNPSRRDFLATLSALGLLGLFGCRKADHPLKISSQVWPGFEFLFLAREMGWLNADEVRLVEVTDATDSSRLLADGLLDGASFTLDEVLRARANGVALTVIAVFDVSAGADALLVRPGIKSLADLKGKRIGVEETALGGLLLSKALQAGGLAVEQITLVHSSVEQHLDVWNNGKVDALVTYSPAAEKLEKLGALRLFDSRAIPDTIVDVLAVKPEAIQTHGIALRHLIEAHFRAQDFFLNNPQEASYRMAARLGVPAGEVEKLFSGLRLIRLVENRRLLSKDTQLARTARELSGQLVAQKMVRGPDDLQDLFDAQFLSPSDGGYK